MKKGKVFCVFFLILFLSNGNYAQVLNNPANLSTYGLYQVHLQSGWVFDESATDDNMLTFKHYINGQMNYNVRIKQQPFVCPTSTDFKNQVRDQFNFHYKNGNPIDKFDPKSDYNLLGHNNCHLMTYIDKVTGNRGFILNAHVDGKRYSFFIFDRVNKKKELRKEVIDFINGISLVNSVPQSITVIENSTKPKKKNNILSILDDVVKVVQTIAEIDVSVQTTPENKKSTENPNKTSETGKTINNPNNNKTEPVTQEKKPTTVTQTINLEVIADIPSSKPLPFLDITTLSKTEWDGAVSAAMEGMRLVYGSLTASENKQFEKSWAPLRHIPFKEAVDYLNKFNPLLGEFLTYRTSITQTSSLMEEAIQNAGYAAQYDDPQSSLAYFDLGKKYQTLLISRQKRLQQITNDLVALGNPPDGAQMMAEQQRRYKQEKDYLNSFMGSGFDPAGCWAGHLNHFSDFDLGMGEVHTPLYYYVYKIPVNGIDTYYAIEISSKMVLPPGIKAAVSPALILDISSAKSNDLIRKNFTTRNYVEKNVNSGMVAILLNQFDYPTIPKFTETSEERYQKLIQEIGKRPAFRYPKGSSPSDPFSVGVSRKNDQNLFEKSIKDNNIIADVFFKTALQWTNENKWQDFKHSGSKPPQELLSKFLDEINDGGRDLVTQNPSNPNNSTSSTKTQSETITDNSNSGVNNLHIIDDKNPADRRKIDAQAIEFHTTNLAIIQKNMARDQQDLAKEKDPNRIKDFEMRILGAQANIQAEKDRIATIQTGIIVYNRSPWDDYAKSNFIQNIAENQQKMESISRGIRKAYEMADRLPDEEARKVRDIINTKYNGKIMANLDEKAAKDIIEEANSVGKKYFQGKMDVALTNNKEALAEAAWADACLETAQIVKTTADYSMMGLSMFGGKYINNTYQGITGYIEGGPKEAFLRVSGSYNTITGVAVDGFRGFEDAVNKGGDFIDGFKGAGWEAAKGLITEKAMAFGIGKISGSYNRPNGDITHIDGPTKTGQSAGSTSANTRKIPRVGEPDFNRPLSAQEIAIHREQIADGRNKVNSYKNTFDKLETARKAGAPPSEIKKILIELDDRSAKIHSSPQAKMMMKTMQKHPKNLDMIKRYSNSMDRIHQKVEKRYQAEMQKNGWSPEELQAIRNKPDPADLQRARDKQAKGETVDPMDLLGSKTVNMDYDAGRKPKIGADGKPIPPMKNGKPVPVEAWHKEAQDAWERAYEAETGQNAKKSWENITHGKIPDAYADLNVLQKNGILHANKQWAGQTADVTYYKAEHLRDQAEFQRVEKFVEIARGTSKDYRTKMEPLFNQKKPKSGTPSFEAWQKHKNYWDKVNGVLNDMGSGKKDPMTADREIRQLSGGKSVLEVTFDMRNFMESLLLLGTNN